jgi:hypothetical protein
MKSFWMLPWEFSPLVPSPPWEREAVLANQATKALASG